MAASRSVLVSGARTPMGKLLGSLNLVVERAGGPGAEERLCGGGGQGDALVLCVPGS